MEIVKENAWSPRDLQWHLPAGSDPYNARNSNFEGRVTSNPPADDRVFRSEHSGIPWDRIDALHLISCGYEFASAARAAQSLPAAALTAFRCN
ncbi:hypothetical protein EVAR_15060_1 [Eumeta japonica]|uniref:Uncharacterized protein n=1 Tax=Eumeta variegata TaxID=151549 RepID=A0A4C1YHH1_EUMVA|nr:hypothetical protein EVAR_15060_1 [Eumeta japonica]